MVLKKNIKKMKSILLMVLVFFFTVFLMQNKLMPKKLIEISSNSYNYFSKILNNLKKDNK